MNTRQEEVLASVGNDRLERMLENAIDAFWDQIAKAVPEATSGDLSFGDEVTFKNIAHQTVTAMADQQLHHEGRPCHAGHGADAEGAS